jgi:hypothetical protein
LLNLKPLNNLVCLNFVAALVLQSFGLRLGSSGLCVTATRGDGETLSLVTGNGPCIVDLPGSVSPSEAKLKF